MLFKATKQASITPPCQHVAGMRSFPAAVIIVVQVDSLSVLIHSSGLTICRTTILFINDRR